MKVVEKGYRKMTESTEINEENVKKNFMPKDMIQRTINICLAIFTLLLEIAVQKNGDIDTWENACHFTNSFGPTTVQQFREITFHMKADYYRVIVCNKMKEGSLNYLFNLQWHSFVVTKIKNFTIKDVYVSPCMPVFIIYSPIFLSQT